jgi:MOSC domain-containing protein YiiM
MASILELRVGMPKNPDEIREVKPCWPPMANGSAYDKVVVGPTVTVKRDGMEGNAAGFPGHIDDMQNRAILVYNENTYDQLQQLFPDCQSTLVRGGFGENILVNHDSLLPSVVCIGDKFRIGTTVCVVTGPRPPCPKVDAWHATKGLTKYCKENGTAGYFLRVDTEGICSVGDVFELLERPYPTFTIERVSQGLWATDDRMDNSEHFLSTLAGMNMLIRRHYRDTATIRLERLHAET